MVRCTSRGNNRVNLKQLHEAKYYGSEHPIVQQVRDMVNRDDNDYNILTTETETTIPANETDVATNDLTKTFGPPEDLSLRRMFWRIEVANPRSHVEVMIHLYEGDDFPDSIVYISYYHHM